jgi:hypothetical protein
MPGAGVWQSDKGSVVIDNQAETLDAYAAQQTIMKPTDAVISQVMAEMGRRGGRIGGKKRMESMGKKGRSEFARAAVNVRWAKYRAQQKACRKTKEDAAV